MHFDTAPFRKRQLHPAPRPAPGPMTGVSAVEAKEILEGGRAVLVDVREPFEWAQAHVPGAVHIPLMQVPARAAELPRDRTLLLFCRSGNRSAYAANVLRAMGFADVLNVEDGILGWHQAGLPLEAGDG